MALENCPKCEKKIHPPLKSTGRQVCTNCGWSDKKDISELSSSEPTPKSNSSDSSASLSEQILPNPKQSLNKSEYILLAIFIGLIFNQFNKSSYEYAIVSPSDYTFESSMNSYGSKGWKTTTCRRATDRITDSASYECIMIREKKFLF